MKKKILSLVLAVLLIVPAMFMLTACAPSTIEVSTYAELKQALKGNNDIIKVTADINVEDSLVVGRKVVLDLNGKKLYNENDIWDKSPNSWSIISVRQNGNLTLKGNGKVITKENDCYALDVIDGGKLVVEDGEYVGNVSAVYAYDGAVEIKGGKYSIQQLNTNKVEGPYGLTINIYNNNDASKPQLAKKATVSITGGRFVNFNPSIDNPNDELVAEGYVAREYMGDGEGAEKGFEVRPAAE